MIVKKKPNRKTLFKSSTIRLDIYNQIKELVNQGKGKSVKSIIENCLLENLLNNRGENK